MRLHGVPWQVSCAKISQCMWYRRWAALVKALEMRFAGAGIKEDAKRAAAAASGEYNPAPAGVGNAWSHNFLNQSASA